MGKVAVNEHLPMQEISLIAKTRIDFSPWEENFDKSIIKFLLFFVKRIKIDIVKKLKIRARVY
jgi:hypothetical protein